MSATPTELLRSPGQLGGDGEGIEAPLSDKVKRRNRVRTPTVRVVADDIPVQPVTSEDKPAIESARSRDATAGKVSVVGLANKEPREGQFLTAYINGNLIGSGRIHSANLNDAGILTVTAYDDTRRLLRTSFSGSYKNASIGRVVKDIATNAAVATAIPDKYFSLDDEELGGDIPEGYKRIVDETGEDTLTGEQTTRSNSSSSDTERSYPTVTYDYQSENSAQALNDLAEAADALWWVMPSNSLAFTDTPQVREISVNGITESQTGSKELPYTKVVITGASKKQAEGDRRRPRRSKDIIRAVAGDKSAPPSQTFRPDPRQRIRTQKMAKNVANSVLKELKRQRKSGTLDLVGRAAVFPDDVVQTPPYYGGEEYLVTAVNHTIDSDAGFMSTLSLGGTI